MHEFPYVPDAPDEFYVAPVLLVAAYDPFGSRRLLHVTVCTSGDIEIFSPASEGAVARSEWERVAVDKSVLAQELGALTAYRTSQVFYQGGHLELRPEVFEHLGDAQERAQEILTESQAVTRRHLRPMWEDDD